VCVEKRKGWLWRVAPVTTQSQHTTQSQLAARHCKTHTADTESERRLCIPMRVSVRGGAIPLDWREGGREGGREWEGGREGESGREGH
jgi:hypothetical protein